MKKFIFTIVALLFLGISCKDTNENPVQERGKYVVPYMSDPSPAFFSDNLEESYIQFDLSLTGGETVDKVSLEVVRLRDSKSAILKDVSLPATGLRITANEVLSALSISPSDYNLGDVFNLYVLTTKNGVVTRSTAAHSIVVMCYFDPSMLVGNFYYVSEDWDEEGSVTIEADLEDPYKVYVYGVAESQGLTSNGNPIELNINPNNFNITGPKSVIADNLDDWGFPANYTNHYYQVISGSYSPCDEMYTVVFQIGVDPGNWGNFVFIFTNE